MYVQNVPRGTFRTGLFVKTLMYLFRAGGSTPLSNTQRKVGSFRSMFKNKPYAMLPPSSALAPHADFGHTRRERQGPTCDQSGSQPCAKDAQGWGTLGAVVRAGRAPVSDSHFSKGARSGAPSAFRPQFKDKPALYFPRNVARPPWKNLQDGTTESFLRSGRDCGP